MPVSPCEVRGTPAAQSVKPNSESQVSESGWKQDAWQERPSTFYKGWIKEALKSETTDAWGPASKTKGPNGSLHSEQQES